MRARRQMLNTVNVDFKLVIIVDLLVNYNKRTTSSSIIV